MAIIKQINYKGIVAEYLSITHYEYDKLSDTTIGVVSLYKDKKSRRLDEKNNILKQFKFIFDGELARPELYTKIKMPRIKKVLKTPYIPAEYDTITGELIKEEQPAIFEEVETNELVGASDDI